MSDAGIAWRPQARPAASILAELTSRFGPPRVPIEGTESWLIWNDAGKQNRFDLHQECGMVEALYVRIHAGRSDAAGRRLVIELANEFDCMLWPRGDHEFLTASIEDLSAALDHSHALAFVKDPDGYIRAASKKT